MIPAIMLLHFSLYSVDVFLSYGNLPPFPGSENGQKIWVNILETIHWPKNGTRSEQKWPQIQ